MMFSVHIGEWAHFDEKVVMRRRHSEMGGILLYLEVRSNMGDTWANRGAYEVEIVAR